MNILTFDIEEWYHILDNESTKNEKEWLNYEVRIHSNVDRILTKLTDYKLKATFFCLGWIAEKYPEVIKKIDQSGHEIGSHSEMHQLFYELSKNDAKYDIERSIKILEDTTGNKVKSFRAPGFSVTEKNKWIFELLVENGIEIDSSVFPASRAHGGLPSFNYSKPCLVEYEGYKLKEFPINTYNLLGQNMIFSGGGYFRLLPEYFLKKMFDQSEYVMTYFHPRDFDPGQPVIKGLSLFRKFKSYYGLGGAIKKFENLMKGFEFIDLQTASAQINWDKAKIIKL